MSSQKICHIQQHLQLCNDNYIGIVYNNTDSANNSTNDNKNHNVKEKNIVIVKELTVYTKDLSINHVTKRNSKSTETIVYMIKEKMNKRLNDHAFAKTEKITQIHC